MLLITKSVFVMMSSFILSCIFAIFVIPILKRFANQSLSIYLRDTHKKKEHTPTMGGIIFVIPTIIVMLMLLMFNKIHMSYSLLIMIVVFLGYFMIGFIDDMLIVVKHNNKGLSEGAKLLMQLVIAIIFFYLFMLADNEPLLWIHSLGIKMYIGWFYGLFILLVLVASSNAVNLTDGLDGLAGGLSLISFLAMGIIAWGSTWASGNEDMAIFCFILVGSLLGFLFYNTYPAKVFMGDTGSLALGSALATVAILTSHEITLVIIAGVFVVETLSSIIQILSIKYRHKKVFLMAPLHHHFEKLGWAEQDIVKLFYFFGLVLCMTSIAFGVWL